MRQFAPAGDYQLKRRNVLWPTTTHLGGRRTDRIADGTMRVGRRDDHGVAAAVPGNLRQSRAKRSKTANVMNVWTTE
jgi:hypothetical protein